jgi:hypothetical protein
MPLSNYLEGQGGRPRKHSTAEAATYAKKESDRRRYQQSLQAIGLADFIAYEPPLHLDVLADTRPEISLRTSFDVRIPQNRDIQFHLLDNGNSQHCNA